MQNKKTIWIAVFSLLALLLAGCSYPDQSHEKEMKEETTSAITAPAAAAPSTSSGDTAAPVKEFTVESYTNIVGGQYHPRYSIGQMNVIKWDKVIIHIKTTSGMHDFNLDEFNVHSETPKDEVTTVEFIADQTGSFQYYCSKPGHRAAGHWGTLVVDEPSDK